MQFAAGKPDGKKHKKAGEGESRENKRRGKTHADEGNQ